MLTIGSKLRSKFLGLVVAITTMFSSVDAAANPVPFDVMATSVVYNPRGGCTISFELTNSYPETLQVSADVFISTFEAVTIGDGYLSFPPAVSNGKSRASAAFYNFKLAGRDCPHGGFRFTVVTKYCKIVGSSFMLADRACLFSKEFQYGKPLQ